MHVHLKPETMTVRVFEDGKSYDNRDAFIGVCTVHFIGDKEVYLCGFHGHFPTSVRLSLARDLKKMGIDTVRWEHKGKLIIFNI